MRSCVTKAVAKQSGRRDRVRLRGVRTRPSPGRVPSQANVGVQGGRQASQQSDIGLGRGADQRPRVSSSGVVGSVSLGYGPGGKRIRRKVFGKTKQEVRDRLKALHEELNSGVRSSSTYTAREAVDDWLREGLDGTSERTRTLYESLLEPVLEVIGARLLRDLGARDVRAALSQLGPRYSTRSLQITRNSLERAIRHAESNDLVGRNVAALVKTPEGRSGRPSNSFTLEQAKALLAASESTRLHAYVVLSLLVGIRT